jgi:hypothetical protein
MLVCVGCESSAEARAQRGQGRRKRREKPVEGERGCQVHCLHDVPSAVCESSSASRHGETRTESCDADEHYPRACVSGCHEDIALTLTSHIPVSSSMRKRSVSPSNLRMQICSESLWRQIPRGLSSASLHSLHDRASSVPPSFPLHFLWENVRPSPFLGPGYWRHKIEYVDLNV